MYSTHQTSLRSLYPLEMSYVYCCQLWHPPEGWKFLLIQWKFGHKVISMLKRCVPKFKANTLIQKKILKIYQHGAVVRNLSQLWTLTPSQGLNWFFFAHEIFGVRPPLCWLCVKKIHFQEIYLWKHIPNLPTCVAVRNKQGNHFIRYVQLWHPP